MSFFCTRRSYDRVCPSRRRAVLPALVFLLFILRKSVWYGHGKGGCTPRPLILVCILELMASHPRSSASRIDRMSSSPRCASSPHPKTHFTTSPTPQPYPNPHRAPLAINNEEPPVPLFIPRQLGPRPRGNKNVSFWSQDA
jgi:hypothetical protein